MQQVEQKIYDMGFSDAENSSGAVVFEAQLIGFMQGWMAVVDTLNSSKTSPFKDPT